ncbi:heme-binding protein 2-like [Glandiceps talaboti]
MFNAVKNFFFSQIETPEFTVIEKNEELEYELREYSAAKWTSTTVEGASYDKAGTTSFWRLFKYIQGNNETGQKIAMTAPVTACVKHGAGPNCESSFTFSFYVPKEHHDNAPTPKAEEVFQTEHSKRKVFVRSFSGFAKEEQWLTQARKLAEALGDRDDIHKDFFYTAGYDSPFKLMNRHNEVWIMVKDNEE